MNTETKLPESPKSYYQRNKDKLIEKAKQHYNQHKEEYKKKYEENKDKYHEKYLKNKEKMRQRYLQNREQLIKASCERQKIKVEQKRKQKEEFKQIINLLKEGKVQVIPIQETTENLQNNNLICV